MPLKPLLCLALFATLTNACGTSHSGDVDARDVAPDVAGDAAPEGDEDVTEPGADTDEDVDLDVDASDADVAPMDVTPPDAAADGDDADDADADDVEDADDATTDADADACPPDVERNACGGCTELVGELGAWCGCDMGLWTCDGAEQVVCLDYRGRRLLYDRDQDGWGVVDRPPLDDCMANQMPATRGIDCNDANERIYPGDRLTATRCDVTGEFREQCQADGTYGWQDCPAGSCSYGRCWGMAGYCSPGGPECARGCNPTDEPVCVEFPWSGEGEIISLCGGAMDNCTMQGLACVDGACTPPVCGVSGTPPWACVETDAGPSVGACNAGRDGFDPVALCPAGESCVDARCVGTRWLVWASWDADSRRASVTAARVDTTGPANARDHLEIYRSDDVVRDLEFSYDGRWLAVVLEDEEGIRRVDLVSLADSTASTVAEGWAQIDSLSWSPTGAMLAWLGLRSGEFTPKAVALPLVDGVAVGDVITRDAPQAFTVHIDPWNAVCVHEPASVFLSRYDCQVADGRLARSREESDWVEWGAPLDFSARPSREFALTRMSGAPIYTGLPGDLVSIQLRGIRDGTYNVATYVDPLDVPEVTVPDAALDTDLAQAWIVYRDEQPDVMWQIRRHHVFDYRSRAFDLVTESATEITAIDINGVDSSTLELVPAPPTTP